MCARAFGVFLLDRSRELLKARVFSRRGRQPEENISRVKTLVSPDFHANHLLWREDTWQCKCVCVKTSQKGKQLTSGCRPRLKNARA